jgi:VanZ family protein
MTENFKHNFKYNILWTIFLFVYLYIIFYFSSKSTLPIHYTFANEDKFFHFSEYFVLGLIFFFNLEGKHSKWFKIFIALFILSYPILDEWHQSFVPGRDSSIYDAMTDYLGMSLGFLLIEKIWRKIHGKNIRNG